jgi:ADP-heptose:LPS heptosyltransferase
MGDILLATPTVRALSVHFQPTEIDFVVGRGMGDALAGIPYLRRIVEFDKNGDDVRPARFLSLLADIRRQRYDLFVNLHPSAKTVAMAVASGARRTLTFHKDRRRQRDTGRVRHAVDDFTKELLPLGVPPVTDRRLDFAVPDSATARVTDLLATEFQVRPADLLLVVNPAATRDVNRWPPERFAALMDRLVADRPDIRLALTGGRHDLDLVRTVLSAMQHPHRVADLSGRLSVKELGALLARANCVLTADTGPLHIASAVGAPIVCLSGAADPDRTGPLNPIDLVVIRTDLPCVPCQARTCRRHDIACMRGLPVDWVYEAVLRRIQIQIACAAGASVPLDRVGPAIASFAAEGGKGRDGGSWSAMVERSGVRFDCGEAATRCNGTLPPAAQAIRTDTATDRRFV